MKIKTGLLAACFLIAGFTSILQGQQATFTRVYYDVYGSAQGYAMLKTFDRNYLIAGEKDNKALVMKVDTGGNILWSKKIGSIINTRFTCIAATHDSCFYLCGRIPDTLTGNYKIFVVKITSSGDTLWTRTLETGYSALPFSIQPTADNGLILTGSLALDIAPYSKIVVIKLNSSGNLSWCNFISAGNETTYAASIRQTTDGGFIITGEMDSYSPYKAAAYLIKLSSSGAISWVKKLTGGTNDYFSGFDVIETLSGFVCLISSTNKGSIILKTDFSGDFLWGRNYQTFSGSIYNESPAPKLNRTNDGGYVFATTGWGGEPMMKIDSTGNFQWGQSLLLISTDVVETYDHGFLVLGNGPIMGVKMAPTDHPQIGLIKTDSLGNNFVGCVSSMFFLTDSLTVNIVPVSYSAVSGGALISSHPVVSNAGLSIFDGCVAITGSVADQKPESVFQVTPNPSDGHVQIVLHPQQQTITTLSIFNVMGEIIYESPHSPDHLQSIDLSGRPNGVYYIVAQISGTRYSQKIVICH